MLVTKSFKFDSSHRLPGYVGKCNNLHGHTWKLTVSVEGQRDLETGFVVDFAVLSKAVQPYLDEFDHHHLNDIIANPTCENLLWFLGTCLQNLEPRWVMLELSETEDNSAMLTREEFDGRVS